MTQRFRILDNLKANGVGYTVGTEHTLDLADAELQLLARQGVIEPIASEEPDVPVTGSPSAPEVMLIGSNVQPAVFNLAGQRYTLGELVLEAQQASGLPPEAWNELPDDSREAAIEAARVRVGAELVEPTAAAAPSDANAAGADAGVDTAAKPGKKSK